ncbi:hypothetical protein ACVIHI_008284 [Bradyrhizobium sp. USDA 4524]|uniref:hypothetical protein n=1 Tax=unclassified Bradyrhizobium TaxID=2631580 RepID=UPI0020A1A81B|nr:MULTISPECIES: hypothetical protein [unclassified Bradyrhizobium]MCP1838794.1 hypothetical protein [Bradyrhizobium sp. USDA 4538]MCP1899360.1 hypothetical protein [Bradyrhizobium sp. USDA 4537]MCP1986528.1 hypothetical protein [Bradyrhizobium sp. USDA 4539]
MRVVFCWTWPRSIGEHIGLGLVQEGGKLGQLGAELIGDAAPLGQAAWASSWAKAVAWRKRRAVHEPVNRFGE